MGVSAEISVPLKILDDLITTPTEWPSAYKKWLLIEIYVEAFFIEMVLVSYSQIKLPDLCNKQHKISLD